jgi:aspartyl-tRNA(Asn)/glutamyl-tRNA(Gln) amidotransferase subunit C
MSLTNKDVEYVAGLARIDLPEAEKEDLTRHLGNILGYMEKLNELDTEMVEPTSHVLPLSNVFREDVVVPSYPPETMLKLSSSSTKGHYKVPKIIAGQE